MILLFEASSKDFSVSSGCFLFHYYFAVSGYKSAKGKRRKRKDWRENGRR